MQKKAMFTTEEGLKRILKREFGERRFILVKNNGDYVAKSFSWTEKQEALKTGSLLFAGDAWIFRKTFKNPILGKIINIEKY